MRIGASGNFGSVFTPIRSIIDSSTGDPSALISTSKSTVGTVHTFNDGPAEPVGAAVETTVGTADGAVDGHDVGDTVGNTEGTADGPMVGNTSEEKDNPAEG